MNYPLAQIILAARNSDRDDIGWMQMLVVVVMAAIWVVGGIFKVKANKKAEAEEDKQREPGRKLGLKPPGRISARKTYYEQMKRSLAGPADRQARPRVQPPRRKIVAAEPVARKVAAKTEQDLLLESLEIQEPSKAPLTVRPIELKELISKPAKMAEFTHPRIPAEKTGAKPTIESLLGLEGPEDLRTAILHYEILGKPLGLRDRVGGEI